MLPHGDDRMGGVLETVRFKTASGAGYMLVTMGIDWDFRQQVARRRVGAVSRDGAGCAIDYSIDRDLDFQRCRWTWMPTLGESFVCEVLPLFDAAYGWETTPVVSISCSGIQTAPERGWPVRDHGDGDHRQAGRPAHGRRRPAPGRHRRCGEGGTT